MTDQQARETLRQAMTDWDNATDEQRAEALRIASTSGVTFDELLETSVAGAPAVAVAATKHVNASQDYAELRQEAVQLARRILAELDSDTEPEGVQWGHVGSMAHVRTQLRGINDQLFNEGEYAE